LERALFDASNGEVSEHVSIKSGVPQGGIWSPLLFGLFCDEPSPMGVGGSAGGMALLY